MRLGKRSWVAPLSGVVVGVAIFVSVNIATGRAILPTVASVSGALADPDAQPGAEAQPIGTYQRVCGVCHQPQGQGIPFAFPPLAGSPWMTGDPETPIRIVLLGMGGAIDVNGTSFNLVMPPPPALDDAMIAEAISYARTNFGNNASAVDAEMVKKVRESLGGRTTPWTAAELTALRTGAAVGGAAANAATGEPGAAAPTQGAAPAAPAKAAAAAAGTKKGRSKASRGGASGR